MKKFKGLIYLLAFCMLVGTVTGCTKKNETSELTSTENHADETQEQTQEETEAYTIPETEAPTEKQYPAPSIPAEKTFASDEETYKYAISQLNEGKYYLAVKYLRKIPNYKDSQAQQIKAINAMKQDYLRYDEIQGKVIAIKGMNATALASGNVIKRSDANLVNTEVLQRLEYGYIDTAGNLKVVSNDMPSVIYENVYKPLLEYNKTVKFQKMCINWDVDYRKKYVPSRVTILTKDGKIIYYWFMDSSTGAYKTSTEEVTAQALKSGEKIVDINEEYALSNLGTVYFFQYEYNGDSTFLACMDELSNLTVLPSGSGMSAHKNLLAVDVNGIIVGTKAELDLYPVTRSWSDIISLECPVWASSYTYYCGLASSGEVLVAYENGTETLKPFPAGKKYVAITCDAEKIVAVAATGEVYVESMPTPTNINSGTIKFPMESNTVDTSGTDKTFASNEEMYNYAKSCISERKYCEAIKYLRKIPDYKDSKSLQDDVYWYINHDFVLSHEVRYIEQDTLFHYTDKDLILKTKRQSFMFDDIYIDAQGELYVSDRNMRDIEYYNMYFKPLVEYNKKVKYKFISYSEIQITQNSMMYVLTEDGDVLYIDKNPKLNEGRLVPIDTSQFAKGEKISYISNNVAVSNKGFVYYLDGAKVTKDKNMTDIVTVKAFNGILMALTTNGKIVYSQPDFYEDISGLSTWTDVVAIDMFSESSKANYFIGLKSDGTVVTMRSGNLEAEMGFPKDKKFVTLFYNKKGRVVAFTAENEIYIYDVLNAKKKKIA